MKIGIALVTAILAACTLVYASDWPVSKTLKSVDRLVACNPINDKECEGTSCSAFAFTERLLMTAAHCSSRYDLFFYGQRKATKAIVDEAEDLAVLEITGEAKLVPLKLGSRPRPGQPTLAFGYGLDSPSALLFPGLFMGEFDPWNKYRDRSIYSVNGMKGMSGGPIIDTRGKVIGVVQGGGSPAEPFQNIGYGSRYEALHRLWRLYDEN